MKKNTAITAICISILVCILTVLCYDHRDQSEDVNYANIRQIRLGDTKDEVVKIMGEPNSINENIFRYDRNKSSVFEYSILWVHFEGNNVREVYCKMKSRLWKEEGVYRLSSDHGMWEALSFENDFAM